MKSIRSLVGNEAFLWRLGRGLRDKVLATRGALTRVFQRDDEYQIVICGFPRSGSSLLYNILTASIADADYVQKESSGKCFLHKRGSWISKLPNDVFLLKDISRLNWRKKKILVLLLSRDIRDIITSVHQLYTDDYYIDYDKRIHGGPGIGDIYVAYVDAKTNCLGGEVRVVPVSYEDILFNLSSLEREICGFLGCELLCSFNDYHDKGRGLVYGVKSGATGKYEAGPVVAVRHEKWRDHTHKLRIINEFKRSPELFEILVELGYETDDSWYQEV